MTTNAANHLHSAELGKGSGNSIVVQRDSFPAPVVSASTLVGRETRTAKLLRSAFFVFLLVVGATISALVFVYTRSQEQAQFARHFEYSAFKVIESFHDVVEQNLGAIGTLSTFITGYAQGHQNTTSFPFVTIPDFELYAQQARVQSGSHSIAWTPLITNENRAKWEEYALENRYQIDKSFERDNFFRHVQDAQFGLNDSIEQAGNNNGGGGRTRDLQRDTSTVRNETKLGDGTNFHPKIWSNGATGGVRGDEPEGSEPYYFPAWQRSPVSPNEQGLLNLNAAKTRAMNFVHEAIVLDQKAAMNAAVVPVPTMRPIAQGTLRASQFREEVEDLVDSPQTWVSYPVFDSFDQGTRRVAGILVAAFYWEIIFANLLPQSSVGIICVLENSYNQTFSYRIDGEKVRFLGNEDYHNPEFHADLEYSEDMNTHLQQRAAVRNKAYTSVDFNEDVGKYRIRVYPSEDTKAEYVTNNPIIFAGAVAAAFAMAALFLVLFATVVERRHRIVMGTAIENAQKATAAEREINEFLSHEIRNPLSAAMSACSFVSATVDQQETKMDQEVRNIVDEDLEVINSSLNFINDFLRNMLDIHRADHKKLKLKIAPADLLKDVIEPVSAMLYKRTANYDFIFECPSNLVVLTDSLRLKQVILNLVRNSSKFVEQGFIRLRADVNEKDSNVRIYVEDSGPGVPEHKLDALFSKYQESLDSLSQGTGIGLSLSKELMKSMNGDLSHDNSYESGVAGFPGTRFIAVLNSTPIDIESALPTNGETKEQDFDQSPATKVSVQDEGSITSVSNQQQSIPDNLSVLFVDDEVVLRKLFARAARKVGPNWTVKEASSGEAMLKMCECERFDVIFLDQYMASVDKQLLGTEAAQRLRQKGVKSKICGLSANDVGQAFISAGADYFLMKPIPCKTEELKHAVAEVLFGEYPVDRF